ncbi:hypothetical protein SAMN05421780_11122 [Flexibacter flexilis DSM 6793]|uniref:Uncharacterized protein n=1 Tax=Flexibacter flexilis DSM 6793 TaxID=927664 RepID=A0A1I1MNE5_9BACT|nr:hypothetical protein SAMN05421780_11122 [Flexibacter flexilis DSM 6793]
MEKEPKGRKPKKEESSRVISVSRWYFTSTDYSVLNQILAYKVKKQRRKSIFTF